LNFEKLREEMVERQLISRGIKDRMVLEAMKKVPRHLFIEEALQYQAYGDYPLPIGEGQTISQPYMVALMTEALALNADDKVLEIGTGSGYQTAILAELSNRVYSIERIKVLADRARKVLDELNYYNIRIKISDGTQGWQEEGPFDAIIIAAGAPHTPQPLVDQLKVGGRLAIPIGDKLSQALKRITKKEDRVVEEDLGGCRFVSLIGKFGWEE
jgi:protein-L-isoaspartate(D-aspartate) O-methyltransferase